MSGELFMLYFTFSIGLLGIVAGIYLNKGKNKEKQINTKNIRLKNKTIRKIRKIHTHY